MKSNSYIDYTRGKIYLYSLYLYEKTLIIYNSGYVNAIKECFYRYFKE
jgi:hypothetical protein